ncbi:MAG: hypothetical protein MUF05_07540 [Candidatus Omnitrophica bacterium]|jgi:hypothetical protein|nr:hypothetical protein [Candidatus Omnitrophota bacterium]
MSTWQWVLLDPGKAVLGQIGQFIVSLLLVVLILILGWIVANIVKGIATKILRMVKLDELSDRIELDSLLEKGGIKYSLSELIGVACYWIILLVTFVVAVNAIGLTVAADLLQKVILYIPNIVAAVFILILGLFVAKLLSNIVQTASSNAGLSQGIFLTKIVEIVVIVFSVIIALEQLNIAVKMLENTIMIILASAGLGCALAFGLGCRDMAAKAMNDFVEKLKKK